MSFTPIVCIEVIRIFLANAAPWAWYVILSMFLLANGFSKGVVEKVEKRAVEFFFVRTESQLADFFTKALPGERCGFILATWDEESFARIIQKSS